MLRAATTAAAIFAALAMASTASANHAHQGQTLQQRAALQRWVIGHDRRVVQAFRLTRAIRKAAHDPSLWFIPGPSYKSYRFHSAQLRWTQRELRETLKAIAAQKASAVPSVPAWAVQAFLCIHGYEGSWTDTGDPYWGGLQMDRSFMETYGSWAVKKYGGWANVWPPSVQIAVAYRAYRSGRGFYPWPNTARYCHLI